ncbi:MAG: S9 family peptidase [Sphingobacteriaceae bacterium]
MKKILLLLLISTSVFAQQKKEITLEDLFKKGTFSTKGIRGLRSMNDGKTYVSIETDEKSKIKYVAKNNFSDGKLNTILFKETDLIFKGDTLPLSTDFSADESKVLIPVGEEQIYRRSFKANYFVFDLKTKKITEVSSKGKQLFASFSPDGSKVAFVRENNLFVKDLVSGDEKQLTLDGKNNEIINGMCDWVYEEEFSFAQAFYWSPDGKRIAYYRFNETAVPEYSMTMFEGLYPSEYRYKYPKAGEKNSTVSIHVYDLASHSSKTVQIGNETDQYIPRIRWTQDPNTLCVLRLNRHQNQLNYLLADVASGESRVLMTETDKYYVDIEKEQLTFLANGKQFINVSERDGYNHLYLYDLKGKLVKQITTGKWEVTDVYGFDQKKGLIYYQSTESSPLQRDVFVINLSGKNKRKISTLPGTNNASFSTDFSFYIMANQSAKTPNYVTLHSNDGKLIRTLEDNSKAKNTIASYQVSPTEFFSFTTSEGVSLNGYMIKPANFDPNKKYPVFMYVYGGPGSQNVLDSWGGSRTMWFNYLAQKGYVVACVDNRGTGARGAEFKKMTYLNLGKYETIDQIEAAKWFAKQPFVDGKRIGIWGWSYGGYMSSLCITKGADVFSMAIAVAPVTTWRFYDSIYTERYLRTPQENPAGYDDNSPINFADRLKGKFLLIHGTGDDNVHFQNSVMFSEALIQADKAFEQAYYPNKNHGIYGGNTTIQLYRKMTDFILTNL